jgi:hypothetical protein
MPLIRRLLRAHGNNVPVKKEIAHQGLNQGPLRRRSICQLMELWAATDRYSSCQKIYYTPVCSWLHTNATSRGIGDNRAKLARMQNGKVCKTTRNWFRRDLIDRDCSLLWLTKTDVNQPPILQRSQVKPEPISQGVVSLARYLGHWSTATLPLRAKL